jgi:predicted acylesterase/phospholipase RssA
MYDTLCISGGGIHMLSLIGAYYKLPLTIISNIKKYYGTSAGAVMVFLISIGYTQKELYLLGSNFDISKLLSKKIDIFNIINNNGIDNGYKLEKLLRLLLNKKLNITDITFGELYNLNSIELNIITTNYTKKKEFIFNYLNTPNISIIIAVRASLSIPLFFFPIKIGKDEFIDGGVSNNFAYNHCNPNTTLGLRILPYNNNEPIKTRNVGEILKFIISCINITTNNYYTISKNIISIESSGKFIMDIYLSKDKKLELINNGIKATLAWIKKQD